jgi:hypothetical protein
MNADTIRELLNRRPFEPFEVITSSGERHTITYPEFLRLTASRAVVVDPITDQVAMLSLVHITELRAVDSRASAS